LPAQPLTLVFGNKGGAHSGRIMTYGSDLRRVPHRTPG
jgi:hypothetical protein